VRGNGTLSFLHGDHLGSATLTTDIHGNRIGELRYTPYGVTRYEWGNTPTDRRYTGQRWEGGLGLYDYRTRSYHPVLGRFISADTVVPGPGNPQGLNRYAYVHNNSLKYTDPDGRIPLDWILDFGGIAFDVYQLIRAPSWENAGWLALDVVLWAIPYVPTVAGVLAKGGKGILQVSRHSDEIGDIARLGSWMADFSKIAHIPGAERLLGKLLSASPTTVRGAEFELEFALRYADEIEEIGRVVEVIQGGQKEIDFVLKGNVFVNVKNYDWTAYTEFTINEATTKLVREAQSFFKYEPAAIKYVFKGSVPEKVRKALESAGIIVEVLP
jgi:RHS repeat-associated protein